MIVRDPLRVGVMSEMTPGGQASTPKLYLFTQESCVNCPAAKAVVHEAFDGTDINVQTVDLQNLDGDLEFRLLENQIFIASTPAILIEYGGRLKMLHSGDVPTVEEIQKEVRNFA
ncbi:MAG: hypothetical protein ACP6KW_07365 [Candidatus Thorarchaeota archaeon]